MDQANPLPIGAKTNQHYQKKNPDITFSKVSIRNLKYTIEVVHALLGDPMIRNTRGASQNAQYNNVTITHEMVVFHLGDSSLLSLNLSKSAAEILKHLGSHGCKDVTNDLNLSKSSEYPITFGGFGDVYRGALHDGSRVAIKCLRLHLERTDNAKKELKSAARELYVWSKCKHPNVLGLIGVAQYRNQIAMVSPWMEYGNVKKFMGLELSINRYELCAQISDSVAYLHQVGVVHGDIKGDNILISHDLTPKLTDFGSAGLREYTLQFSRTTSKANVSLNWAAPEMLDEDAKPTTAADVFSLGMTIFELITGSKPYANMNEHAVLTLVMRNEHPIRPEEFIPSNTLYGPHLWLLLTRCWACDPQDRPSSVGVRDEIRAVIREKEMENRQVGDVGV